MLATGTPNPDLLQLILDHGNIMTFFQLIIVHLIVLEFYSSIVMIASGNIRWIPIVRSIDNYFFNSKFFFQKLSTNFCLKTITIKIMQKYICSKHYLLKCVCCNVSLIFILWFHLYLILLSFFLIALYFYDFEKNSPFVFRFFKAFKTWYFHWICCCRLKLSIYMLLRYFRKYATIQK